MKALIAPVSRVACVLATLLAAGSASAGWFSGRGDCSPTAYGPCARQEGADALQRARRMDGLNCRCLVSYAESTRLAMNARILATIHRPLSGPSAPSSTAPLPSIEPPFTPAPKPPADPTAPVFAPEKPKAESDANPGNDLSKDKPQDALPK